MGTNAMPIHRIRGIRIGGSSVLTGWEKNRHGRRKRATSWHWRRVLDGAQESAETTGEDERPTALEMVLCTRPQRVPWKWALTGQHIVEFVTGFETLDPSVVGGPQIGRAHV